MIARGVLPRSIPNRASFFNPVKIRLVAVAGNISNAVAFTVKFAVDIIVGAVGKCKLAVVYGYRGSVVRVYDCPAVKRKRTAVDRNAHPLRIDCRRFYRNPAFAVKISALVPFRGVEIHTDGSSHYVAVSHPADYKRIHIRRIFAHISFEGGACRGFRGVAVVVVGNVYRYRIEFHIHGVDARRPHIYGVHAVAVCSAEQRNLSAVYGNFSAGGVYPVRV